MRFELLGGREKFKKCLLISGAHISNSLHICTYHNSHMTVTCTGVRH